MRMIDVFDAALRELPPLSKTGNPSMTLGVVLDGWADLDEESPPPILGVRAVSALRRGHSVTSRIDGRTETKVDGVVHVDSGFSFLAPVPYAGVVIIDGHAYDARAFAEDLALRAVAWARTAWAEAESRFQQLPDDGESYDLACWFEPEGTTMLFAPAVPASTLTRVIRAEHDARVVPLACGGVVLWPLDGALANVRAYLLLDTERLRPDATIRAGELVFDCAPAATMIVDGDDVSLVIAVGDAIRTGQVIGTVDGQPLAATSSGTVVRIDRASAELDEIRAVARREAEADFRRDALAYLHGRTAPSKIVNDDATLMFKKGDPIQFATTPSLRMLIEILDCFDDAARLREHGGELHDNHAPLLAGLGGSSVAQPDTWLVIAPLDPDRSRAAAHARIVIEPPSEDLPLPAGFDRFG